MSSQLLEAEQHCTTLKQQFNETVSNLELEKESLTQSVEQGRVKLEQSSAKCMTLKRQVDQLTKDLEYQQRYVEKQQDEAQREIEQLKDQLDQVSTWLKGRNRNF